MKAKILIVDDEPMNLDFFDLMLSKLGFEVLSAGDGLEALEKVKATHPDLILLDNVMPKMSGWQVTKVLKSDEEYLQYRDIPIIMFSAMDDVQDKIEGFELGVEDYITKPFNFSEVIARIRAVLKNREVHRSMLSKDQGMRLGKTLSDSVKLVVDSLKAPLGQILTDSENLDPADSSAVRRFVDNVRRETSGILASFKEIENYITNFESQSGFDSSGSNLLEDFDKRIKANFLEEQSDK
ncbi:MAG: response regulator [Spirochaetes bacterium]|nr:MAG: response regulator [Spirochaetota bacterium]